MGIVPGESPPVRTRRHTLKNMCEVLWGPVLSSLSHVMVHCADPLVVSTAVDGYKAFAVAAGILGESFFFFNRNEASVNRYLTSRGVACFSRFVCYV